MLLGNARRFLVLITLSLMASAHAAVELEGTETARRAWQLLDYIAVDYAGALRDGKIVRQSEYDEMSEFAATAAKALAGLSDTPGRQHLRTEAAGLIALIQSKADARLVAQKAHALASDLLDAYPFPVSPSRAPDVARGASLFAAQCSACHGLTGKADGPLAASLTPSPTSLADRVRARERSPTALFPIISQGVEGTAMPSFKATLSDADRWALAYYAGTLSYSDAQKTAGATTWRSNAPARDAIGTLDSLSRTSESALAAKVPSNVAEQAIAWVPHRSERLALGA